MPQIFRTSIKTGKTELWETIKYPADTSDMVVDLVKYRSKDGTQVPMFIIHRKDMRRDGDNPTLLTGYGGFGASLSPSFSTSAVVWLEHGGVVAMPGLRGGAEYGEAWHRAGTLGNKPRVFEDFIGAAEYLIAEKITRPGRLGISGGSNGGLLVGAAMVQRPELFKAVVCAVPLLDMVRYHKFGAGKTWTEEYGSADDPAQFEFLHAYSPYHRVQEGAKYPAMLMMSADSDDRVDPMHARKFAAAVAWASRSGEPVLLRVERNAGHGGADLVKSAVEYSADQYAFLAAQLGASARRGAGAGAAKAEPEAVKAQPGAK
jgi:prolyl oligopeptidase